VSAHYVSDNWRAELMGIAGNYQINPDKFRERGYVGFFEYFVTPKSAIGVSSLVTVAKEDRLLLDGQSMTRMAHGATFRSGLTESVAFMLEIDALTRSRYEVGYVGFAQVDFEAVQGLHFMLTGEMLDAGHKKTIVGQTVTPRVAGEGKPKVGGWASVGWWFLPHFDVRVDAIQRTGEDLQLLAQLHCYL
jgi:hypothetical protein